MEETFFEPETAVETRSENHHQESSTEPGALAVSAGDFAALEERIHRAVELVKQERQARASAEERAAKAEEKLHTQSPALEKLQSEMSALRTERDQVRQRVERLLSQLDSLEL